MRRNPMMPNADVPGAYLGQMPQQAAASNPITDMMPLPEPPAQRVSDRQYFAELDQYNQMVAGQGRPADPAARGGRWWRVGFNRQGVAPPRQDSRQRPNSFGVTPDMGPLPPGGNHPDDSLPSRPGESPVRMPEEPLPIKSDRLPDDEYFEMLEEYQRLVDEHEKRLNREANPNRVSDEQYFAELDEYNRLVAEYERKLAERRGRVSGYPDTPGDPGIWHSPTDDERWAALDRYQEQWREADRQAGGVPHDPGLTGPPDPGRPEESPAATDSEESPAAADPGGYGMEGLSDEQVIEYAAWINGQGPMPRWWKAGMPTPQVEQPERRQGQPEGRGGTPAHLLSNGRTWRENEAAGDSRALQGNIDRMRNERLDPQGAKNFDDVTEGRMLPFEGMQGVSPFWAKQISDWARENYRRPRPEDREDVQNARRVQEAMRSTGGPGALQNVPREVVNRLRELGVAKPVSKLMREMQRALRRANMNDQDPEVLRIRAEIREEILKANDPRIVELANDYKDFLRGIEGLEDWDGLDEMVDILAADERDGDLPSNRGDRLNELWEEMLGRITNLDETLAKEFHDRWVNNPLHGEIENTLRTANSLSREIMDALDSPAANAAASTSRGQSPQGRAGRPPAQLQSEALRQVGTLANRIMQGRGGAKMRQALDAYRGALASGDPAAIQKALTEFMDQLDARGVLSRFEERYAREAGASGGDLRQAFTDRLERELTQQMQGQQQGMGAMPGGRQSGGGMGQQPPRQQGGGGVQAMQERTPDGRPISRFDSVDSAMQAIRGGTANLQEGQLAVIGGNPMMVVGGQDRMGRPEFQFVGAMMMGGVPVPDPEGMSASEWGAMLSDNARSAILDELAGNRQFRASMSPEMLNTIDRIRRSRVGLLAQNMSPRDRDAAMRDLQRQENEAMYAALAGGVGGRARAQTSLDMEAQRTEAIKAEEQRIADERARADEERRRQDKDRERALNRQDQALNAIRNSVPMHSELSEYLTPGESLDGEAPGRQPSLRPDVGATQLWNLMSEQQRANAVRMLSAVSIMAPQGLDQKGDWEARHLPLSALKRVLSLAGRDANEWSIAAAIEVAKPGYIRATYGDNAQLVGGMVGEFSRWSQRYNEAITAAGDDRSSLMSFFLEQHSWMVVRDGMGMLDTTPGPVDENGNREPSEKEFWDGLRSEFRSDPQEFARYMMTRGSRSDSATRGGAQASAPGAGLSQEARAQMASFPSPAPPTAFLEAEVGGSKKALPIPTTYRDSRTGNMATPPLSPVAITPANTKLFSGVEEVEQAKSQYDQDGTGPIAVLMRRFPDMDAEAIVQSQTMLAGASPEDLARAMVPGSLDPRRRNRGDGAVAGRTRRLGEDLNRRIRDPEGFRSESSAKSAVDAAGRAQEIVTQVFDDMVPRRHGRGFKSTYALRQIGPDGSLQRFDGSGWKSDPDLTRDFWVSMSVLGRISWKDFDRGEAASQ